MKLPTAKQKKFLEKMKHDEVSTKDIAKITGLKGIALGGFISGLCRSNMLRPIERLSLGNTLYERILEVK